MDDNQVTVLLEDLMSQFRTFGEGFQLLNETMDTHIEENREKLKAIQTNLDQNRQEHQQLMQMIKKLVKEPLGAKEKQRLFAKLMRRGFEIDDINKALNKGGTYD